MTERAKFASSASSPAASDNANDVPSRKRPHTLLKLKELKQIGGERVFAVPPYLVGREPLLQEAPTMDGSQSV